MASVSSQLSTAWALFEIATPTVHLLALWLTSPTGRRRQLPKLALLSWPIAGGHKTLIFQLLSWALFAISLMLALAPKLSLRPADATELDIINACAGFAAVISVLFMVKSVLLFDPSSTSTQPDTSTALAVSSKTGAAGKNVSNAPKRPPPQFARMTTKLKCAWQQLRSGSVAVQWEASRMPSRIAAFYIIVAIGVLWSGLGAALLVAANLVGGKLGVAYIAFSAACFVISAMTTHGLGGHLRHRYILETAQQQQSHRKHNDRWRFYQPFQGGVSFVATQALGWMLYSTVIAITLWGAIGTSLGVFKIVHSLSVAVGTSAVVAELILAASLLAYNARGEGPAGLPTIRELSFKRQAIVDALNHVGVICVTYIQVHLFIATWILSYLLCPLVFAAAFWVGVATVYYALTGFGKPHVTGVREWPAFQDWLGGNIQRFLPAWLGGKFEVVLDSAATKEDFDPQKRKFIFGFVPHGLFPVSAGYLPVTPAFRHLLPGIRPPPLTASVSFHIPVIRDILMWSGLRVVSRHSFIHALRERGAVLVVPGGQAELVETHKMVKSRHPECVLYIRHKGFVRLAIHEQASLVPIVCFGEATSLRNFVDMPALQRWTYKKIGFPIPFLVVGKWGWLPLPSRSGGIRFVIGKPLDPPKLEAGHQEPTKAQVDELHQRFYQEVERIWKQHRGAVKGYENMPLVMI